MKTVVQHFLAQAEKHPQNIAVLDIQGAYTYDQLNRRSAYLAEQILALLSRDGKQKGRVALLLPRTKEYLTALLAVLRACCAAVPMDAEYPAERVRAMLEDVGCALCVTTKNREKELAGTPCLFLEDVFPEGEDVPKADTALDLSDLDAEGLILYTSGSTGKPKGVIHRQKELNVNPDTMTGVLPLSESTRTLCIAGFSFIASLIDLTLPLFFGGSVYIANETERKNVDMLWALFGKRRITGMFLPPQMYGVMRKLHGPLPLEYVLLSGEKARVEHTADDPLVYEFYGASESPSMLMHRMGEGDARSLGKPCRGISAYLMDEEGRFLTEPGVIGELCIDSPYMAIGYHGLPEETAKKFTDHPSLQGHRLFHTGDYMAWDENGDLIFHGRKDHMVKVRGYRVELDEVRRAAARFEGVEEAACVPVQVNGGDHICCYYTGREASPEALKAFIGASLPEYMVPEYCVHLDALPRNDRNKVDFQALKALEIRTEEAEYEPPETELEKTICRAFAETLEMERASVTADFFACGGTSLSAAVLISRLDGYALSFQDISAHPTPRKLAAFLESKKDAKLPPMDRADYPLTKTQLGIYLESMTGGSKETYTCSYLAQAAPEVTAEQLIRAARALIAAHPGMQYIIRAGADGMPRMVMTPEAEIDVPVFDGTEENRLDFMKTFMPVVPMMDSVLLHLAVYRTPVRCYLAIKSHLIFFDGTAISQFIAEMNRALAGKPLAGEECTIQQAAMIEERQLADGTHEKAKEYYLNLFRDAEDVPALPGDLNGPLTPGVSENMRYEPGTLTAERVKAFCEKEHISESSFFMGAMALMLGKYLNSQHVSFSTVYNGRPLSEMSHTMGTLIKRIPVYGDLRKDQPVGDFLRGVSKQVFTTMANDIYSFDEVLKTCPVNEDVEFIYQGDLFTDNMGTSAGETLLQGDKWFMEHYHTGMVTGCMSIQFFSTAGLYNMTVEYRNEKFTEKWVRRFAQDLFTTAEQLLTASSIGQVSLLTAEDRKQLAAFNDTAVPMDFIPVQEQIHRHALSQPDKIAVMAAGKRLTFRELDQLTNALAKVLIATGAGTDRLIGVLFDREIWAYVAEIAVLKAGAAFLPFIPEYPDDRIDFCLEDGACPLLLSTKRQMEGRALQAKGCRVLTLEEAFQVESLKEIRPDTITAAYPNVAVSPENLAYCIYTSGSTGRPKGVMIEHRNIMNYVHRNEKSLEIMHYASPGRVNLALASFSFDVSVVEEFVPLCNGNTVIIATEAEIHDPALFARLVKETKADGITCTPTYLLSLLEIPESREAIRQFTFFDIGAEAFPRQLYDRLRELRQDSVILNVYGPTECTMGCAAALMTGGEQVTVGPPIANTVFYVADPFGNELPVGQKGELIICGDQVGRGYVNLPDKSAAAFFIHNGLRAYHSGDLAAWTENGEIRIFGRIDNQIKLRGFRIELDEIEKVMTEFPGVSSSAAAVRKTGGTEYLAGYFTAKKDVSVGDLKAFMQEKLPEYMVPNVLMQLDEMPMTTNGKVNRKALPEPDLQELKAEYIPPETETEKALCAAFAKTLKLEENKVGLLDDFFDLGGDSLRAMVVLSEAKIDGLTAADVFQLRTPGAIAKELEKRAGRESLDEREQKARLVPHDISPLQLQMIDNQLFRPGSTMWSNMHFLARFEKDVDAERLCAAVNKALKNHTALSVAFFFDENNELKQKYVPGLLPEVKVRDILPETEDALSDILIMPFNRILNACLCRVNVFRGRKGCYLFMDAHHLLMDGGSLGVVLGDIMNAYFGRELKPDYYFAMLSEAEERAAEGSTKKDHAWFTERYGDQEDDWCSIPAPDHESTNINQAGRMRRLSFDAEQVAAAEEYWGVSHSVIAISAGIMALSRFTEKKHVMINWIFNNRLAPEAENTVGMLIRNLPAAIRMEDVSSVREMLHSVKEQVAEGIAHASWDFMSETRQAYVNDCMEVNLQLGINGDEMDALPHELIELKDEFSAAGARLELELLENEFGDGGFDSEMEYAEGLFDKERIEAFHDLYIEILERIILGRDEIL
ncbi:MAG: amino acid adenylation domain-containing protein [Clostridia bacterium]|nr:amino acid adenylation domain-containing protein [Clostridia bacterium]